MKVSLQLIPEQPIEELLGAAQLANELGYYARSSNSPSGSTARRAERPD